MMGPSTEPRSRLRRSGFSFPMRPQASLLPLEKENPTHFVRERGSLAEGVGFEPTIPVKVCRFSRPVRSTRLRHPSDCRLVQAVGRAAKLRRVAAGFKRSVLSIPGTWPTGIFRNPGTDCILRRIKQYGIHPCAIPSFSYSFASCWPHLYSDRSTPSNSRPSWARQPPG